MLHDIGHYPMSHNIEQAYQDSANKRKYDDEPVASNLKYYVNCPDFLSPTAMLDKKSTIVHGEESEEEKNEKLIAEENF